MKSNVLKSSLAAFAFALAIVASFAFSPALNSTDEVAPVQGYIQTLATYTPCAISISTCQISTTGTLCTSGADAVYLLESGPGLLKCTYQLYVPEI